jgi:molybdenum cofactor synthesis domain-containing protein
MELICVGNELLIGKTLNTNAYWLAKRATSLGMIVTRISVVMDDTEEIISAVREALQRKPKFVITTGGLGPTFDDKTSKGIARALKRRLEVNEKALKMVKEKYEAYARAGRIQSLELTPSRVKMANLPEGAKPLPNPVGTAPGVLIRVRGTFVIALPGVPSEMEAIFEESVVPMLKKEAGELVFSETSIYVDDIMESTLAPLVEKVMHDAPNVYIKSHPREEERKPHLEIHFSTVAKDSTTAENSIEKAIAHLSELVTKAGAKIKPSKS